MFKKIITLLLSGSGFLFSLIAAAQPKAEEVEMATGLRSSGKIYVVVAVLLTILVGILLYVIRLDRRISKLEKVS